MVRSEHKKHKNARGIPAVILTILVVVLAVLVFLYRDRLSPSGLSENSEDLADMASNDDPFTYETGSQQVFALMGDKLAIASSTGLQLLDIAGNTVSREVFSMTNPAVCASDTSCAFYDAGGYSLRIYKDGAFVDLEGESELISVTVSGSGYYAVSAFEPGYKGSVTVYDQALKTVFKWYSGTGYVIDAAVSPDNASLAVLCAESTGSVVHLFHLNSETERGSVSIPNELGFKLSFQAGGTICVLSEQAIHFFSSGGKELSVYNFGENYLVDYELSEDYRAVVLSKYVSGSDVTLLSFSSSGNETGSATLSAEPLSLFSQSGKLLVFGTADISLYSAELRLQKQNHVVPGYVSAVLLPKGSVLLLSSHFGEKCEFR